MPYPAFQSATLYSSAGGYGDFKGLSFRLESLDPSLKEKVEADINEMRLMISAALDFLRDQAAHRTRVRLDLRLLVESVVDDQRDVGHDVTWLEAESASGSLLIEGDAGLFDLLRAWEPEE